MDHYTISQSESHAHYEDVKNWQSGQVFCFLTVHSQGRPALGSFPIIVRMIGLIPPWQVYPQHQESGRTTPSLALIQQASTGQHSKSRTYLSGPELGEATSGVSHSGLPLQQRIMTACINIILAEGKGACLGKSSSFCS